MPKPLTTRISTKGQVILPKVVRTRRGWDAGMELVVEETSQGVVLRPAPRFSATTTDQVFGVLKAKGPARTIEEMDAGVLAEAQRTWRAGD